MTFYKSFTDCFSDKRLDTRCSKVVGSLFAKGVHSIRQLTSTSSEAKGFYRFLQNDRTKEEVLISDMSERCKASCKDKIVLCIQDSTEVNMHNHHNRLKPDGFLGTTNAPESGLGFLLHPSLVVDAQSCIPYGFSHIKIWNRPEKKITKKERQYKRLPIEASELEYGRNIRKLCLLMLDTIIKLFLMQIVYAIPEEEGILADSCFTSQEQECLEAITADLEGKTEKQKNNSKAKTLKRCVWAVARLGGWKGYQSERPPGITTLWIALQQFSAIKKGYMIKRNVSTR